MKLPLATIPLAVLFLAACTTPEVRFVVRQPAILVGHYENHDLRFRTTLELKEDGTFLLLREDLEFELEAAIAGRAVSRSPFSKGTWKVNGTYLELSDDGSGPAVLAGSFRTVLARGIFALAPADSPFQPSKTLEVLTYLYKEPNQTAHPTTL